MEAFLLGGILGYLLYTIYGEIALYALHLLAISIFFSAILTFIIIKISAKYK